ncbi:MAG TPA: hypothetical protein VEJ37_12575 [Xanthobacteraceae bacterium]|nr:hypothetical protein [Xanthobacteraceae bacterium]
MMPGRLRSRARGFPEHALDYEIAQEQAAALARLGRALECALAALSDHDSTQARRGREGAARFSPAAPTRQQLVQEASYALWCFVVQREACGLRDQRLVVRAYAVPREVQNRMGMRAATAALPRSSDS